MHVKDIRRQNRRALAKTVGGVIRAVIFEME